MGLLFLKGLAPVATIPFEDLDCVKDKAINKQVFTQVEILRETLFKVWACPLYRIHIRYIYIYIYEYITCIKFEKLSATIY